MSLFSNATRVVNTATPDFPTEPNVTQYGWTKSDAASYNQLIQYVDECRKIWLNLEEKILYVEELLVTVGNIDAQVKYIEQMTNAVVQLHGETKTYRDQVSNLYTEVKPLYDDFIIKYNDVVVKWADIVKMHEETGQAAIAAALSEISAAASAKTASDIAEELRKGQVYRGTWNLEANNSYPPTPDTNSVWDVVLGEGTLSFNFDGKVWYWGDRLLYIKDDNKFTQIESGGSVTSVNGKTGAVTLGAADVGAAPAGFGLGGEGQSWADKTCDDINASGFYSIYSSTTGTPYGSGGPSGSQLIHTRWGGGAGGSQMFFSYTSDRVHFRRRYQSVWQPWFELYHTGKKPTLNELGAMDKAGDIMTGPLGIGGPMTLGKNLVKGENNAVVLRDHGNGNVTISASVGTTGEAGTLYLGYNAALAGTAGYNTKDVWINAPTKWQGKQTIIDGAGMVNSENFTGPIRTEKDSGGIYHTIIGGNDTINRGRTIVAAGECGKHIADNTSTGAETLHIGADGADGVYAHVGLQNGWAGASHYRYQFRNSDITVQKMDGTTAYKFYHEGFNPTATAVGALPITGGTVLGELLVKPGTDKALINLIQAPRAAGTAAMGVTGWNAAGNTREWGTGLFYRDAVPEYAYLGIGTSPWSNGLKVFADGAEFNQKLSVNNQLNLRNTFNEAISLNYAAGPGSYIRGREDGNNDWYVGRANASGHVALYSDKLSNGLVIRDDYTEAVKPLRVGSAGVVYYAQHASTRDLNTLSATLDAGIYHQDANANATPARNYPIQEAGTLLVTGSAYGVQQEYTTFSSNRKFIRGKNNASTWLPWNELGGVKAHMSGYRFPSATIPVGGSVNLMPSIFGSFSGIEMGSGIATVRKSGTYKIDWGFSLEPVNNTNQNAVGSIYVNNAETYPSMIYNYCPGSSTAVVQMGISSTSIIIKLNANDQLKFNVKAVNSTTARIYQAGHIVIQQL